MEACSEVLLMLILWAIIGIKNYLNTLYIIYCTARVHATYFPLVFHSFLVPLSFLVQHFNLIIFVLFFRTVERSNFKSIIHISAITQSESSNIHLVAVTQTGKCSNTCIKWTLSKSYSQLGAVHKKGRNLLWHLYWRNPEYIWYELYVSYPGRIVQWNSYYLIPEYIWLQPDESELDRFVWYHLNRLIPASDILLMTDLKK